MAMRMWWSRWWARYLSRMKNVDTNDTALCLLQTGIKENRPEKVQDVQFFFASSSCYILIEYDHNPISNCPSNYSHFYYRPLTLQPTIHMSVLYCDVILIMLLAKMLLHTFCQSLSWRRKDRKQNTDSYKYSWNWQQRYPSICPGFFFPKGWNRGGRRRCYKLKR